MKTLLKYLFFLLLTLAFFSCSTMSSAFFEETGEVIADHINKGMDESLVEKSLYPFAFESEILVAENQVQLLWKGLAGSGYKIASPRTVLTRPIVLEDYTMFSESWEMRTFFEKYLYEDDRLIEVEGDYSTLFFLVRKNDNDFSILGMKEQGK